MRLRLDASIGAPAARPRNDRLPTLAAVIAIIAAGGYATHAATDGLQAFTLESARRLRALESPAPVPVPEVELADAPRAALIERPGQIQLVDFIYTRCATYCRSLGSVYAELQARLAAEIASGAVRLLSVSFDPAYDGPQRLAEYRSRHGGNAQGWALARPLKPLDLGPLLRAFGVVVIADGFGGYTHNAALHVVDRRGRLAAILDADDMDGAVRIVRELLAAGSDASP